MPRVEIQAQLVPATDKEQGGAPDATHQGYPQFQETHYGPELEIPHQNDQNHCVKPNSNKDQSAGMAEQDDCSLEIFDVDTASFWDVLASLWMLFLWFQRSTFGAVGLIRSLVLGHCLQFLFRTTMVTLSSSSNSNSDCLTAAENQSHDGIGVRKYFQLMQSLLLGAGANSTNSSSSPHKQVNGAWPPPAIVALATLTILALVVHPDGLTWILLRKIRDTFMALLQSSTTCWAIMIRDYGVVGTVSASASITLVLILAIAMHKAFLPNYCCSSTGPNAMATKRRNMATEKKRRRRKGHHSRGGRIRGSPNSNVSSSPSIPCPRLPKVEEVASDGASVSANATRRNSEVLKALEEEGFAKQPTATETKPVDLDTKRSVDNQINQEEEGGSIMTSPSALESVVSDDFEAKGRTPVPSVCTVDTTTMADDISCSSFSVRSVQQQQQQQQPVRQTKSRANKSKPNATRGGKANGKANPGQKQPKTTTKVNAGQAKNRADFQKTAKPATRTKTSGTDAPGRFDQFKKQNGQKRNEGGKGRVAGTQNSRGTRKGGRVAKNQRNQPNAQTSYAPNADKSTPNLQSRKAPPVLNPSPKTKLENGSGIRESLDNRPPPFSPCTQSLFSCEIGASGWSLPSLPAVSQPNAHLAPALSYQTNPFVTPYSQMPTDYNSAGRTTPVVLPEATLWNSVEPITPSAAEGRELNQFTTPKRPLRAPPGLPTPPPGFSDASLAQPILTASDFSTPVRTFGMGPTPPTYGRAAKSTPPLVLSGMCLGGSSGLSTPLSTTNDFNRMKGNRVKDNPFAADKGNPNEAECRIEAELQELGGRMIGSVLDF